MPTASPVVGAAAATAAGEVVIVLVVAELVELREVCAAIGSAAAKRMPTLRAIFVIPLVSQPPRRSDLRLATPVPIPLTRHRHPPERREESLPSCNLRGYLW